MTSNDDMEKHIELKKKKKLIDMKKEDVKLLDYISISWLLILTSNDDMEKHIELKNK